MFRAARRVAMVCAIVGCADSSRENIVDPVNVPTIEMSAPVLDGGTVLITWRYYAEGSALNAFDLERSVNGEAFILTRIPVERVTDPLGWKTLAYRDSTVVTGVEILYRVIARFDDTEAARASGTITVEGTRFFRTAADDLDIHFEWRDPPEGTVGYDLTRERNGASIETIFRTSDPMAAIFVDTTVEGNVDYSYTLVTRFQGGGAIQSSAIQVRLYPERTPLAFGGGQVATPSRGIWRTYLSTTDPNGYHVHVVNGNGTLTLSNYVRNGFASGGNTLSIDTIGTPGYDSASMSLLGPTPDAEILKQHELYFGAITGEGTEAYLAVILWSDPPGSGFYAPGSSMMWPANGATRTGLTLIDDRILFFAGDVLRELDDELEALAAIPLPMGEPLDMAYEGGRIWLVYSNRLYRSNPASSLAEVSVWEEVGLPDGTLPTAIGLVSGHVVVLDASHARLHFFDFDGRRRLSMGAPGVDLEHGDVFTHSDPALHLVDGRGTLYILLREGV